MEEDEGYNRFFAYISLFTFSMLMLVMSNNFLQLFFGWEAVGLVSYLLIGFWYNKPTAIFANMKAFLVNRVGDFGFILGIGLIAAYAGTLNYAETFAKTGELAKLGFGCIGGEGAHRENGSTNRSIGAIGLIRGLLALNDAHRHRRNGFTRSGASKAISRTNCGRFCGDGLPTLCHSRPQGRALAEVMVLGSDGWAIRADVHDGV
jgi:hypothetical protein